MISNGHQGIDIKHQIGNVAAGHYQAQAQAQAQLINEDQHQTGNYKFSSRFLGLEFHLF